MGKKKNKRKNGKNTRRGNNPPPRPLWPTSYGSFWTWPNVIAVLCLILAIIATPEAIEYFWPKIEVSAPSEPMDVHNPFSMVFTVTNAGHYPIKNVKATCEPDFMNTTQHLGMYGFQFAMPSNQFNVIASGDSASTDCSGSVNFGENLADGAALILRVTYVSGWKHSSAFLFVGRHDSQGKLRFFRQPHN